MVPGISELCIVTFRQSFLMEDGSILRWRLYSFSLECFSLCRPDSFLSVQLKSLLKWESSLLGFRIEKESGKKNNFMAFLHHEKLTR